MKTKHLILLVTTILLLGSCNNNNQKVLEPSYKEFNGEVRFMSPDSGYHGYSWHLTDTENRFIVPSNNGGSTTYSTFHIDSTFYWKANISPKKVNLDDNMIFPIYYKRTLNNQIVIDTTIYYQFHEGYNIVKLWY